MRISASGVDRRLVALDGLRGIAILIVMWYHVWEITWLPADVPLGFVTLNFNVFPETGSVGVDLFFFISGFVLFYPYARTLFDGAEMQTVRSFFYRRIVKIVPSYYLALVLLVAFGWATFRDRADAIGQIVSHVFFVHNVWDDTWGGFDGVLWSLSTEVQFYVVFPLVCWCAMRRPLVTFGTLVAFANAYRYVAMSRGDIWHDVDRLPGTIDLFACGMLAAWLSRAIATRRPEIARLRWPWTVVALAAVAAIYAMLAWQFAHRYDPWWNLGWKVGLRPLLDLALVPLTLGSLFAMPWWERVLGNRALVFFSFISYNLYIWHQPVALWIARSWRPFVGIDLHGNRGLGLVFSVVAVLVASAFAWLLTTLFEQPIMRRKPLAKLRLFALRDDGLPKRVPGNIR